MCRRKTCVPLQDNNLCFCQYDSYFSTLRYNTTAIGRCGSNAPLGLGRTKLDMHFRVFVGTHLLCAPDKANAFLTMTVPPRWPTPHDDAPTRTPESFSLVLALPHRTEYRTVIQCYMQKYKMIRDVMTKCHYGVPEFKTTCEMRCSNWQSQTDCCHGWWPI